MQFIENEYTTSTKTEEELIKLTIEEDLSELKRTYFILVKGQIIQKKAIYCNLHKILQEQNACEQILPIILQDLKNKDEEIQIGAAQSLTKAIKLKFMNKDDLKILFQIMVLMLNLWNQNVVDAWVKVFQAFVQVIDQKEYEESINKLILSLTDVSASEISRYGGAKMIGIMSDIRKEGVQGILFEQGRLLCADKDYDVRKVMAGEVLEKLSKNLDPFSIQIYLMPKIFQLVYDKEPQVKCAGVKLLFSIIEYLAIEEQKNRLPKIFLEMMELGQEEVFLTLTEIQGNVFMHLAQYYIKNQQQMKIIIEFLIKQTKHENVQVRKNFAYAFPGILQLLEGSIFNNIYKYYKKMILEDEEPSVRQCLFGSIHEIAKIIGKNETKEKLYDIFKKILKSKDKDIIQAVSQNIQKVIENFYLNDEYEIDYIILNKNESRKGQDIQQQKQINFNQQKQEGLDQDDSKSLNNNSRILTNSQKLDDQKTEKTTFLQEFIERCYDVIKKENWFVKNAIIQLIVYFMSVNYNLNNSKRIIDKFIKSFKESNSFQNRMVFIQFFSEGSFDILSQKFYKDNNLLSVLDLSDDLIYNVRAKLCMNLHRIRYMIDESEDGDEDENLDNQLLYESYLKVKKELFNDEKLEKEIQQAKQNLEQMEFEDDEYIENRKKKEIKLKEYENRKLEIYKQQQQKNLQEQDNSDLDLKYDLSYHNNRGYLKMKKPTYKGSSSNLINTKKTITSTKLEKKGSKLIGRDFNNFDINSNNQSYSSQGKRSSFDIHANNQKKLGQSQIQSRQSHYLNVENKVNNYIRKKSAQKEERDKLPSLYSNQQNGSEQLLQRNKNKIINGGNGINTSTSSIISGNSNNMSIEQIKKSKLHHKYDDIKPRIYTGQSRKQP